MKRERRHELQHNDLAEWILKDYERIVPYRNTILGVGLLVIVLLIGLCSGTATTLPRRARPGIRWEFRCFSRILPTSRRLASCRRPSQTHSGTPAAEWAAVFAGDTALMIGTNKILTDKKAGIEFLTQARDTYTEALETLTIPGAQEQAMFGKARAMESLIQNKANSTRPLRPTRN